MNLLFNPYLLVVLVGTLLVYWCVLRKDSHRLMLLCFSSLGLLGSIHPVFALVILFISLVFYFGQSKSKSIRSLGILVCSALVVHLVGKYGKEILQSFYPQEDWVIHHLVLPLGLSFFVFRFIQYGLDRHRGLVKNTSWLKLLNFFVFFPTLPAGPLESFQSFLCKTSSKFFF